MGVDYTFSTRIGHLAQSQLTKRARERLAKGNASQVRISRFPTLSALTASLGLPSAAESVVELNERQSLIHFRKS